MGDVKHTPANRDYRTGDRRLDRDIALRIPIATVGTRPLGEATHRIRGRPSDNTIAEWTGRIRTNAHPLRQGVGYPERG